MQTNKIIDLIKDKEIILDFDGVITNLNINWIQLKKDLQESIKLEKGLPLERIYLYYQIKNKKEKYINIVNNYEYLGLNTKIISPLFQIILKEKKRYNICSNNTKSVIQKFLKETNSI
jgi:hypothetical protein